MCVKRQPDIFCELIKLKIENKYFCPDKVNLNNQKFIKIIKEFTIGRKSQNIQESKVKVQDMLFGDKAEAKSLHSSNFHFLQ